MTETTIHPTHMSRMKSCKRLRDILGTNPPVDGLMSALFKTIIIDIVKLDEIISRRNLDYDHMKATYKGKPCSLAQAIETIYGAEASELVKLLMTKP